MEVKNIQLFKTELLLILTYILQEYYNQGWIRNNILLFNKHIYYL